MRMRSVRRTALMKLVRLVSERSFQPWMSAMISATVITGGDAGRGVAGAGGGGGLTAGAGAGMACCFSCGAGFAGGGSARV